MQWTGDYVDGAGKPYPALSDFSRLSNVWKWDGSATGTKSKSEANRSKIKGVYTFIHGKLKDCGVANLAEAVGHIVSGAVSDATDLGVLDLPDPAEINYRAFYDRCLFAIRRAARTPSAATPPATAGADANDDSETSSAIVDPDALGDANSAAIDGVTEGAGNMRKRQAART